MKPSPNKLNSACVLMLGLLLAGCSSAHTTRTDKISPAAGDALHSAMVMQTVDPWPEYVLDTDIVMDGELAVKRANDYKAGKTKPLAGERSTGGSATSAGG